MEEQTIMEYAVANRLSVSGVQKAIGAGRLVARKSGKRWLIPAGAIIAPMGEKATTVAPTDQPTEQPTEEDAKIVQLDRELVLLGEEEARVDRKIAIAEKELRLKTALPWDEYQDRLSELREAEAKLVADQEQLSRDREVLSKKGGTLDAMERSLRGSLVGMSGWWNSAGGLVLQIVEAVQAIQYESTYDKSKPQAYRSKGGAYGQGTVPPERTLLVGNALMDRWYEVFRILIQIAKLPEPDFCIDVHRSDVELLDASQFDEPGEQEPEEQDEE